MQDDIRPRREDTSAASEINDQEITKTTAELAVVPHPEDVTANEAGAISLPPMKRAQHHFTKLRAWFHARTKKQLIIMGVAAAIVLVGGGAAVYALTRPEPAPAPAVVEDAEPEPEPPPPTTGPSPLTGVEVPLELTKRQVYAVMIENSPDARPQAGLNEAGLIVEAIAEGGITRFVALFQEAQPDHIGPVRSVRPYYLDFVLPFDAAFAHAGGSAQGLADIGKLKVKDLNHNSSAFARVSNRYAPHNLYTGIPRLEEYANSKGYKKSTVTSLLRKSADPIPGPAPTARTIDFNISSFLYNPHFEYDAASGTYKRSIAGKPHVDEKSGKQLAPKTVVALVMPHRYSGIYSVYQTSGSGTAYVFQDGAVTEATWHKADRRGQLTFTKASGKPLALNAGQTWFSLVGASSAVTYAP